jgi:hypothetical protein
MSDDIFNPNAGIEDQINDLRRLRKLYVEELEKTNIELASIEDVASDAASEMRKYLSDLDLAIKQIDEQIVEQLEFLYPYDDGKNNTSAQTPKSKIAEAHVRTPVEFSLSKEQQMANIMALRTRGLKPETKQYSLDFFCNISSDKKIQPNDIARSAGTGSV